MTEDITHRVWAEIDLDAIAANAKWLRARHPDRGLIAVLKADAYGHGVLPVARTVVAAGATMIGVGDSREALELRRAANQAADPDSRCDHRRRDAGCRRQRRSRHHSLRRSCATPRCGGATTRTHSSGASQDRHGHGASRGAAGPSGRRRAGGAVGVGVAARGCLYPSRELVSRSHRHHESSIRDVPRCRDRDSRSGRSRRTRARAQQRRGLEHGCG